MPVVADPYSGLAANIPANTCGGSYPQEPPKKGPALPASNQWTGSKTLYGNPRAATGKIHVPLFLQVALNLYGAVPRFGARPTGLYAGFTWSLG